MAKEQEKSFTGPNDIMKDNVKENNDVEPLDVVIFGNESKNAENAVYNSLNEPAGPPQQNRPVTRSMKASKGSQSLDHPEQKTIEQPADQNDLNSSSTKSDDTIPRARDPLRPNADSITTTTTITAESKVSITTTIKTTDEKVSQRTSTTNYYPTASESEKNEHENRGSGSGQGQHVQPDLTGINILAAHAGMDDSTARRRTTGEPVPDVRNNTVRRDSNVSQAMNTTRRISTSSGYCNMWTIALGGICLFAAVWYLCPNPLKIDGVSPSLTEDFQLAFKDLQKSFPSQTPQLWKVLRVATRPIMEVKEPEAPATFIFAASREAGRSSECLAKKFSQLLTKTFEARATHVDFDGHISSGKNESPDQIKLAIDVALNTGFEGGSRAAVVHHLEKLHGVSAMMFHGYCDNENASFRRVAIIFTLHMDSPSDGGAGTERDGYVETLLRRRWLDDIDADKFEPLMSRIGNSNVFVRRESDEALAAMGC